MTLPDLVSRLRSAPLAELDPPDDALLLAVIAKLFSDRQLAVEPDVVGYIARRIERSLAAASAAVAAIDSVALAEGRAIGKALAGRVLGATASDAAIPPRGPRVRSGGGAGVAHRRGSVTLDRQREVMTSETAARPRRPARSAPAAASPEPPVGDPPRHPLAHALDAELARSPARFVNRELSWLQFNHRVLAQALNPQHPLLERVRFLSISASNLDEFFMVRVSGLWEQMKAGIATRSQDGLTPAEQLAAIATAVDGLVREQQACWRMLRGALADVAIDVVEPETLDDVDRAFLDNHFLSQVFPVLTPLASIPRIPSRSSRTSASRSRCSCSARPTGAP